MYSRYIGKDAYVPQKQLPATKPMLFTSHLDRSDLLILFILFLTMQDDRSTMLLTAAFYLLL